MLVVERTGLAVRHEGRRWRWHPGLLHTRLEAGERHPVVRALEPLPGEVLVDATLGLGTDAIFLARFTGRPVVGIEIAPVLALLAAEGLRDRGDPVRVICAHSEEWLAGRPDRSVGAIFADPMFPGGRDPNPSLGLVRALAEHAPIGRDWMAHAVRVARRVVVVRDAPAAESDMLERLGAPEVLVPRSGRNRYGRWRIAPRGPATGW